MPWKLADLTARVAWVRTAARAANAPASVAGLDATASILDPDGRGAWFETMLDAFPDPILLVAGGEEADQSSRRFLFANRAAREILPIERDEGPLATAIRAPAVLMAVEKALWARTEEQATYRSGGPQDRIWRAAALPIGGTTAGAGPLALLSLRDDTEAVRVERMRADFLANASHELRTPLASLTGFIETLRGSARDDAAAREKFLAIMQGEAERMRLLIEDLLRLNQIERDEHLPVSGRVDLGQAVQETLDALAPLAAERKIDFAVSFPAPGEATIVGDKHQVLRVIGNLVENAIKYSPDGGRVRLVASGGLDTAAAMAAEGDGVPRHSLLSPDFAVDATYGALRVSDDGPGIAKVHLPRLSERFYRIEGQKGGRRAGTGLGLAIVKHIMRRHRGGFSVASTEGEGATFSVCFRMAAPVAPEPGGDT
ncbi:MAG TPA: ATP-binding protein [Caulobacteraceae bacterium]|nr:ATP-binding protein [Caulobacteraceae bacterium]